MQMRRELNKRKRIEIYAIILAPVKQPSKWLCKMTDIKQTEKTISLRGELLQGVESLFGNVRITNGQLIPNLLFVIVHGCFTLSY